MLDGCGQMGAEQLPGERARRVVVPAEEGHELLEVDGAVAVDVGDADELVDARPGQVRELLAKDVGEVGPGDLAVAVRVGPGERRLHAMQRQAPGQLGAAHLPIVQGELVDVERPVPVDVRLRARHQCVHMLLRGTSPDLCEQVVDLLVRRVQPDGA